MGSKLVALIAREGKNEAFNMEFLPGSLACNDGCTVFGPGESISQAWYRVELTYKDGELTGEVHPVKLGLVLNPEELRLVQDERATAEAIMGTIPFGEAGWSFIPAWRAKIDNYNCVVEAKLVYLDFAVSHSAMRKAAVDMVEDLAGVKK